MKKNAIFFIILLLALYYFNFAGRSYGLLQNYIITGILNFIATFYLLKINPFKKVGLSLLFLPFVLLSATVLYGTINSQVMPGIIGYFMYVFSTLGGLILYRSHQKGRVIIVYTLFLALAFSNYYNLLNIYYSIARDNKVVGTELPNIWIRDKNGKKILLDNNGKILVIDLWSNSCVNCITAFPKFEKVKNDYTNDTSVDFLSINIYHNEKEISEAEKFLKGYTFKNYYSDESLYKKLNFNSVPYYVVVGKDNRIKYFGNLNIETLKTYNNIYKLIENEK